MKLYPLGCAKRDDSFFCREKKATGRLVGRLIIKLIDAFLL